MYTISRYVGDSNILQSVYHVTHQIRLTYHTSAVFSNVKF